MKQEKQRQFIPKLRFPEFLEKGNWSRKFGNEVFEQINNKQYNSNLPLLAITQEYGAIPRDAIDYQVSVTQKSIESYKVIEVGDFIISLRSFQGGIEYSRYRGICSPAYIILRIKGVDFEAYFKHFFKTDRFIKDLNKNIEGLRDGKMVSFKQFSELLLPIPSLPEQQKISDCLTSLDELITAESLKLNLLKTHKNGLMKQLFPAEGETLPQLRFPEFRNAPEWVATHIGEKIDLLTGYPFGGEDISENSSGVRLLRGINITEGQIRHHQDIDRYFLGKTEKLEKYKVKNNDLVIGMDGSKVGKNVALITPSNSGALLVQRVARLRASNPYLIKIIYQQINSKVFHSYVDKINTSSGIPHISAQQIIDFRVCIPSTNEQRKIVDCLSTLDDMITASGQKIESLKFFKKGLMQQLFPHPDEVQL